MVQRYGDFVLYTPPLKPETLLLWGGPFALLLGMYAVTTTSDTIASVMLGIPGTAASQATILDGYPLAQRGEAQRAFGAAFTVSAFGGVFGALLLAASQGHSQLARVLVGLGADVEYRLDGDVTPLHMASINGHSDIAAILVRGGANVDERSADAKTALMIAAANGHDDVVTALLDLGADIETKDKHG